MLGGLDYHSITVAVKRALTALGAMTNPMNTKGDVIVYDGNTPLRKGVGSDGYSLSGSSGDTDGLRYMPPAGCALINGYLDWTVAANALTCAIKGLDGNDPSTTNPVYAWLRSATVTSGIPSLVKITAATSVVVSSGSTLGTRSGIPFRVWAVLFDDAGTYRLGVVNCTTTVANSGAGSDVTAVNSLGIGAWGIASSTAEGGAGAADSAQTVYTGTAVASKAYSLLGYATWEGGQATAGTWATAASRKHLQAARDPLPGQTIQTQRSPTGAVATGTTEIPQDDTIPQNTEGDQYASQAITPTSAANALRSHFCVGGSMSVASSMSIGGIWQDTTANALAAKYFGITTATANGKFSGDVEVCVLAAGTASTTFKGRMGAASGTGGTNSVNGSGGARQFGGVFNTYMTAEEIMG